MLDAGRTATFEVGNHQSECFIDAITPLCDVVAVESAGGTGSAFGIVGSACSSLGGSSCGSLRDFRRSKGEFALATHRLFGILPSVVHVGEIHQQSHQTTHNHNSGGLEPLRPRAFARSFHTIGNDQEEHHKEEIVGHLWVVAIELQTSEQGGDKCAPEIFATIG